MSAGIPDWHHVERAIASGDIARLEEISVVLDGFPAGGDPVMGPWISMFAGGPPDLLRWALARGAPVDPPAEDGFPPLHAAIDAEAPHICDNLSILIEAGADLSRHGFNDWTPLHFAAARGNLDAVRLLLDAGADPSLRTRIDDFATPEEEARRLGQTAAANLIRDHVRASARRR
jgi:uncharacterized protein